MTSCKRCHRPLKIASPDGYGSKCRKIVAATPAHDRDLFGYDLDRATGAAYYRLRVSIETAAAQAYIATRDDFRRARVELLGWEARP